MPRSPYSWQGTQLPEGFYTSEVPAPHACPVRTFLPTGYEPRYAYPLLIFFHGHGGNEEQILRLAPRLSRRNFICIGLRGPQLQERILRIPAPDNRICHGQIDLRQQLRGVPH